MHNRLPLSAVLSYGVLGLPLAFAALPVYVHVPRLYGEFLAIPLAVLGAVLLLTRLGDALLDPWLGLLSDHAPRQRVLWLTMAPFALGVFLLFAPPADAGLPWLLAALLLTYLPFSLLSITYQAWGAELGTDVSARARLTASREGFGLVGVILAAALPTLWPDDLRLGMLRLAQLFLPLLLLAALLALLTPALRGRGIAAAAPPHKGALRRAWAHPALRKLLLVFAVSGTAAALPATLVMFFIADRLQAGAWSGAFLVLYFSCGLLALPLWVKWSQRRGLMPAWRDGMLLSCLAFCTAPWLGAGDLVWFGLICALSGLALGADLALPATQLATMAQHEQGRTREAVAATWFGSWNFVTKLNLALAAGLTLPLLEWAGYRPGSAAADNNLDALALMYGGAPLLGKLLAAALLWRWQKTLELKERKTA